MIDILTTKLAIGSVAPGGYICAWMRAAKCSSLNKCVANANPATYGITQRFPCYNLRMLWPIYFRFGTPGQRKVLVNTGTIWKLLFNNLRITWLIQCEFGVGLLMERESVLSNNHHQFPNVLYAKGDIYTWLCVFLFLFEFLGYKIRIWIQFKIILLDILKSLHEEAAE